MFNLLLTGTTIWTWIFGFFILVLPGIILEKKKRQRLEEEKRLKESVTFSNVKKSSEDDNDDDDNQSDDDNDEEENEVSDNEDKDDIDDEDGGDDENLFDAYWPSIDEFKDMYGIPEGFITNVNEYKMAYKTLKRTILTPKDEIADEKKINDKEKLIAVLDKLEKQLNRDDGYDIAEIMTELDVVECLTNADKIHNQLCTMIDKKIYPYIKVAGEENIIVPIKGNQEATRIYTFGLVKYRIQGEIILGKWVRNNSVNLDNIIAEAGVCKCWVNHETFEKILHYKNLSYDEIKDKTETRQNWFCIYVGCTDDMSNRVKQHVNGSLSSSAMKRNMAEILKDKNLLKDIIDGIYFECIETEQGEKVKEDLLKKYMYILYKGN